MPLQQVQQRLFTGGIFSEEANDQLVDFARRHFLQSPVWVPVRCFDTILKTYGVSVRPAASLLAVPSGDPLSGGSHVVVNAEHTTHRIFLEHFQQYVMPEAVAGGRGRGVGRVVGGLGVPNMPSSLLASQDSHRHGGMANRRGDLLGGNGLPMLNTASSMSAGRSLLDVVPPDALQRCRHPVSVEGEPISHGPTIQLLTRRGEQAGYHSSYWTRMPPPLRADGKGVSSANGNGNTPHVAAHGGPGWYHVEEHPLSGRLNPVWSLHYVPHTLTNQHFPLLVERLMRERTVRYGYVSRLWMTQEEAWRVWRAELLPDVAEHDPPVWCRQFTGGLQVEVYHCADQFSVPPSKVPRAKETHLAASGVDIGAAKLQPFPILHSLVSAAGKRGGGANLAPPPSPPQQRSGVESRNVQAAARGWADSAGRQELLAQQRDRYREVKLFDVWSHENRLTPMLETVLGRERFLRGWASPYFLRSTSVLRYGLTLREDGQQGVVRDQPEWMQSLPIALQQECWFNASQLTEPGVVHELARRPPTSVIWGQPLKGIIAANCARLQLLQRYREHRWVLGQALAVLPHWRLRPGAVAVPFFNYEDASPAAPTHGSYPLLWYNLDEIEGVREKESSMLDQYQPVFQDSKPVTSVALKVFFTLRALQAGFDSPVWVQLPPEEKSRYLTQKKMVRKPPRTGPTNVFSAILPADTTVVLYRGEVYMNEEPYTGTAAATSSPMARELEMGRES